MLLVSAGMLLPGPTVGSLEIEAVTALIQVNTRQGFTNGTQLSAHSEMGMHTRLCTANFHYYRMIGVI